MTRAVAARVRLPGTSAAWWFATLARLVLGVVWLVAGLSKIVDLDPQYVGLLYANQPPENGNGLPEAQLVTLGEQAGAGADFAQCVASNRYAPWTTALTDEASRAGVNATPTIKVGGREIERTDAALRAAVAPAS